MKILQINASYKPAYVYGGPTMSVSKLSEELIKAGCEVTVFTTTANGNTELDVLPGELIKIENVSVVYFKRIIKGHIHFSPKLLFALWKNCRSFDVIHIHAWWNLVSVLSCLIAVLRGCNVVLSPRGTLSTYSFEHKNPLIKRIIHRFLTQPLLKRSNIHATSGYEEHNLRALIDPKRSFVIPNFVALPATISASEHKESEILKLIFLSRIDPKKGLETLFDALALLKRPYLLSIAGDGDNNYINTLKERAERSGISKDISWIGFQKEHKFDVLSDHDLMVLPSRDENFANVVVESLSIGTPVLISPQVGLADYVRSNELGWIIENDPQQITKFIDTVMTTDLQKIRQKAPAIIRADFNDAELCKQYLNMYTQIING